MYRKCRKFLVMMPFVFLGVFFLIVPAARVQASQAAAIDREVYSALETLYESTPAAKALGQNAAGVLVFPSLVKGGFIFGGQYGTGALVQKGSTTGYYRSTAVSYGLQAGIQKFGYALIFMSQEDLNYLSRSSGWEIGVGPTIVVFDAGMASAATTTTIRKGVYAFFFSQKGLMAGLGLQGTKITRIYPIR